MSLFISMYWCSLPIVRKQILVLCASAAEDVLPELTRTKRSPAAAVEVLPHTPDLLVSPTELLGDEMAAAGVERVELFHEIEGQMHNTFRLVDNLLDWYRSQKG